MFEIFISLANRYLNNFSIAKEVDIIYPDLDAFSILLSTNCLGEQQMNSVGNYLLSFGGTSLSRCSFPNTLIASKGKDSIFGCCGNHSQHLPNVLNGNEILVIDTPVKIALHSSCKNDVISFLQSKGYYYKAAHDNTGLCFDPNFAAHKPPYDVVIDAVLHSCTVKTEFIGRRNQNISIIHVADLGCRHLLQSIDRVSSLLDHSKSLRKAGIQMEILQLDIAFVLKTPTDHLIQASSSQKCKRDGSSFFCGTKRKVFPIHTFPDMKKGKMKNSDLKGTILIKKEKWGEDGNNMDLTMGNYDNITDHYLVEDDHGRQGREEISISPSVCHSVKVYSKLSHVQLQQRKNFPLSVSAMYGIGNRRIDTIQAMIENARKVLNHSFNIVKEDGIGLRIEVSIRPPESDSLRYEGHFNDFLLIACVVLKELCNKENRPELTFLRTSSIERKVLNLCTETMSMIRFRQKLSFNAIYPEEKVTEWLRYQMSCLLITMGISPSFDVKYINNWIGDSSRFDPFRHLRITESISDIDIESNMLRRMLSSFTYKLRKLGFNQGSISNLLVLLEKFSESSGIEIFVKLSLKDKHLLSNTLMSEIIPHMSKFLTNTKKKTKENNEGLEGVPFYQKWRSFQKNEEVYEHEDDYNPNTENPQWWDEYALNTGLLAIDDMIDKCPIPNHPLISGILSMIQLNTFWNPNRYGFLSILCYFIMQCHEEVLLELESISNEGVLKLLRKGSGGKILSRNELKTICSCLLGTKAGNRNLKSLQFIKLLCKQYYFPCDDLELELESTEEMELRNKALNQSLTADIAVEVSMDLKKITYYRVSENCLLDIPQRNELFFESKEKNNEEFHDPWNNVCFNLYKLLSAMINYPEEKYLRHNLQNKFDSLKDPDKVFLDSSGVSNPIFKGISSLQELEEKYNFHLILDHSNLIEMIKSRRTIPEVIIALFSITFHVNALFINKMSGSSVLYHYFGNRSISYSCNSCNIITTIPVHVIYQIGHNLWGWRRLSHIEKKTLKFVSQSWKESNYNSLSNKRKHIPSQILGGRIAKMTKLSSIPLRKRAKKGQSFYKALSILLQAIDSNYQDEFENMNNDYFGLGLFLEEVSVCNSISDGQKLFAKSTIENCAELNAPLRVLAQWLLHEELSQYSHHFICPLICLKFSNLIFGVFEYVGKSKTTYFYAFDHKTLKVECKKYSGYCKLSDRPQTLYLYSNKDKSEYYLPEDLSEESLNMNRWKYHYSLKGKYFQLGRKGFCSCLETLEKSCGVENIITGEEKIDQIINPLEALKVPLHVTCYSAKLQYMKYNGKLFFTLLIIFPNFGKSDIQDALLVCHPNQDKDKVLAGTVDYLEKEVSQHKFNLKLETGLPIEVCESSCYVLFYLCLASKCLSISKYVKALQLLKEQTDMNQKIRDWLHFIMIYNKLPSISWMSESTLELIAAEKNMEESNNSEYHDMHMS